MHVTGRVADLKTAHGPSARFTLVCKVLHACLGRQLLRPLSRKQNLPWVYRLANWFLQEALARSGAPKEDVIEPHVGPHSVYKDATKAAGKAADDASPMEVDDSPADQDGAVKLELKGNKAGALKVQLRVAGQEAAVKQEEVKNEPAVDGYVPGADLLAKISDCTILPSVSENNQAIFL